MQSKTYLPDLDLDSGDMPVTQQEDAIDDKPEIKRCRLSLSVSKRLVSRRHVSLHSYPSSHAALKPLCGVAEDNSSAVYIKTFANWKNMIVDLSCFTQRALLPSLLRLMSNSDCGMSDEAVKQCIQQLTRYKKPAHLFGLYSALKSLAAFHPRCSRSVNCRVLEKLPEKRTHGADNLRVYLILDYIVSCVELDLLHYPMAHSRSREVSNMLDVESSLLRRLIHETENRIGDAKMLALLQRAVAAVGIYDKWLFVDRLVSKLHRLYRHIRRVRDRQRLMSSIADPQLRLKLAECVLSARCHSDVRRLPGQFLTADSVCFLSSLLSNWLHTTSVSNADDQIEEYLAVVVTYLETNLHLHRGL